MWPRVFKKTVKYVTPVDYCLVWKHRERCHRFRRTRRRQKPHRDCLCSHHRRWVLHLLPAFPKLYTWKDYAEIATSVIQISLVISPPAAIKILSTTMLVMNLSCGAVNSISGRKFLFKRGASSWAVIPTCDTFLRSSSSTDSLVEKHFSVR